MPKGKKNISYSTHILGSEVADTNIKYHTEKQIHIFISGVKTTKYKYQAPYVYKSQEYKGSCSGGDQDMDVTTIVYNSYYQVLCTDKIFTISLTHKPNFLL